jgi:hypothetical protein
MTAAALWELSVMGIPVTDVRVQTGLDWMEEFYSYEVNPQFGTWWHYYYLWSTARALLNIEMKGGLEDRPLLQSWYDDFAGYLVQHQKADGRWTNPEERYGADPGDELVTEYALLVLLRAAVPYSIPASAYEIHGVRLYADLPVLIFGQLMLDGMPIEGSEFVLWLGLEQFETNCSTAELIEFVFPAAKEANGALITYIIPPNGMVSFVIGSHQLKPEMEGKRYDLPYLPVDPPGAAAVAFF